MTHHLPPSFTSETNVAEETSGLFIERLISAFVFGSRMYSGDGILTLNFEFDDIE